jgi:hypothetical protein
VDRAEAWALAAQPDLAAVDGRSENREAADEDDREKSREDSPEWHRARAEQLDERAVRAGFLRPTRRPLSLAAGEKTMPGQRAWVAQPRQSCGVVSTWLA